MKSDIANLILSGQKTRILADDGGEVSACARKNASKRMCPNAGGGEATVL